jgi:hypothetical protein
VGVWVNRIGKDRSSATIMLSCGGRQFIEIDTEGSGMKWTDPYNDIRLGHLTMTPDQYSSSFLAYPVNPYTHYM